MYRDREKRKPTAIYVTFACMTGAVGYLGFFEGSLFFRILFFWWVLLCCILIGRHGSQLLIGCQSRRSKPPKRRLIGCLLLIGLPFYYDWLFLAIFTSMNGYVFLMLNIPTLTLSFLTFLHVFRIWRALDGSGMLFWGIQIGAYMLIQLMGLAVRKVLLFA